MPKVSIVLPTYNGEKYIRQSIDSIINQTFMDWELIIVNDCSTDSTPQIVEEYASKDERIRVIHNKVNQKLPNSLNIGFRASVGEYLTWTSDDNLYLPDAIKTMVDALTINQGTIMVYTEMMFIDSYGCIIENKYVFDLSEIYKRNCIGACFMYRREVLETIGEYDPSMFLVEDYDYWLRILFMYKSILLIPQKMYLYRVHRQSLTGKRNNEISHRLSTMRKKYIHYIVPEISDDKTTICRFYYQLKSLNMMDEELETFFINYVPEIKLDSIKELGGKIIVYGAGEKGRDFYAEYGKKISYFADRNSKLVGSRINDIEIISLDAMQKKSSEYSVVVAAGYDKIYSFLHELDSLNIKACYVYLYRAK